MTDFIDNRNQKVAQVTNIVGHMMVYKYQDSPDIVEMLDSKYFSKYFKKIDNNCINQSGSQPCCA